MLRFPDEEFTAVPISTRRFTFTINLFLEFSLLLHVLVLKFVKHIKTKNILTLTSMIYIFNPW